MIFPSTVNQGKRIKELLSSTSQTSSPDQSLHCHTTDHCGQPLLVAITRYVALCFLSFPGVSNSKYKETPTLEMLCSY